MCVYKFTVLLLEMCMLLVNTDRLVCVHVYMLYARQHMTDYECLLFCVLSNFNWYNHQTVFIRVVELLSICLYCCSLLSLASVECGL